MSDIQDKYKFRKKIYLTLIAVLFSLMVILSIISPKGEHPASLIELVLFAGMLVIPIAVYMVFRCPNCNASLVKGVEAISY